MKKIYATHPHAINVLILLALVWVAFGASLNFDFAWDDYGLIVDNPDVKSVKSWPTVFARSFWSLGQNMQDPTRSFYRPIIVLSYLMDYAMWGLDARGYHLTNLIVHSLCALVVYLVAFRLFLQPLMAFLSTALFAIHPTHVENVAWISGRTDLFCGLFFFASLYFFLRWRHSNSKAPHLVAATLFCYLLALLSKEMALTLPFLLVAYYALLDRHVFPWKRFGFMLGNIVIITVAYLVLRKITLGTVAAPPAFGTVAERLLTIPMAFMKYIGLLTLFVPIAPHHSEYFIGQAGFVWGMAFYAMSLMYIVAIYVCVRYDRALAFLFLWVPLTLLPVLNLGTFGDVLYADRFLYIPSFGFAAGFILVAQRMASKFQHRRRILGVMAGVLGILYFGSLLVTARAHAHYWRTNIALFSYASTTSTESAYIFFNLGTAYQRENQFADAVAAYLKTIELQPSYREAYTNLGKCLVELGRYEDAIKFYSMGIQQGDTSHFAYEGRASAYRLLGQLQPAIASYISALSVHRTATAHNNLGECLLAAGHPVMAKRHFMQALRIEPSPAIYNNLALVNIEMGSFDVALHYLNQATADLEPSHAEPYTFALNYNYARAYHALGESARASEYAHKALSAAHSTGQLQEMQEADVEQLRRLATME